ncbi:MAG: head GIN domain-containing protein [Bacteroidota bacterium]
MRRLKFLFILIVLPLAFEGCFIDDDTICSRGSGPLETRSFSIEEFTSFNMGISGNVFVTQGETQSVTIQGQENVLNQINTNVSGGTWNINLGKCFRRYEPLEIFITVNSLNGIALSGSGNIIGQTPFDAANMQITLSGSGNITFTIDNSDQINTVLSGSGGIVLSGDVDNHIINVAGSGNVQSFNLESQTSSVNISGSGSADVNVVNALVATIVGSGNIRYRGNPTIERNISGSGNVIDAN